MGRNVVGGGGIYLVKSWPGKNWPGENLATLEIPSSNIALRGNTRALRGSTIALRGSTKKKDEVNITLPKQAHAQIFKAVCHRPIVTIQLGNPWIVQTRVQTWVISL